MTNRVINSKIKHQNSFTGGTVVSKHITFGEKDLELIQKIKIFQKEQEIPTFIEAVRILCKKGIQVTELFNKK